MKKEVRNAQPYFPVDPAFRNASYSKRYELLGRRLVLERLYDAACLTLATNGADTRIEFPAEDLSFRRFVSELQGSVTRFVRN